ncbi:MAG: GTPase HflX [Betaproteobacteria bacterium]|nr:GTPase HflX [Betaproteobacteria bacterium]
MFERPGGGNRAILVQLDFGDGHAAEDLAELGELAASCGAQVQGRVTGRRDRPDAALYAGRGKVAEVRLQVEAHQADLVIFNHVLTGAQQRNLERDLQCRVVDRVALILDIFALRARSAEGKLQVELAQLEHLATRLVRGWTHLERQKGGIGLRGPGETQLEVDRRLLSDRVKLLKDRLAKVARQRETQRRARRRAATRNIALVGYTNAGKSTLFNRLTGARSYAADQLFATLDTTLRKLYIAGAEPLVLSDTVGFIRELPHTLVAAFQATLSEAVEADLLLHIVDSAHPARQEQMDAVEAVLAEIGAAEVPRLTVYNKIDLSGLAPGVERDEYGKICAVRLSAASGEGCELLRQFLAERFALPAPVGAETQPT